MSRLGDHLNHYHDYDAADGPMRAVITADETFVGALIEDFENLLNDNAAVVLK